jgi:RNA polymerase sigma-70 factor (ECF subfamily)
MGEFALDKEAFPPEPALAPARVDARDLVIVHFDFVWRLLRRLGVPSADVDDAAQHVFVVASARLPSIIPGRERSFLFGVALRTAATLRRDSRRRERWVRTGDADGPSGWLTPHEELERRQALTFLDEVLEGLDDDLRTVFVSCDIEELTAAEVAEAQQIPIGTVTSRLRRAREQFSDRIRRLQAARLREK